jgi:hypothetical protein
MQRNLTSTCLHGVDAKGSVRRPKEVPGMSAKAQTLAVPARHLASYVVAVVLALVIGAAAGSIITRTFATDAVTTREHVVGITPWDQQKLDAMAGRQQAETATVDGPGIAPWDQAKLDAMAGFQASAGDRDNG